MDQNNLLRQFFGVQPLARLGQLGDPKVVHQSQVDAIRAQIMGAQPQNVGEGFQAIANGVRANVMQRRLNEQLPEMAGRPGSPFLRGLANMFRGFGG